MHSAATSHLLAVKKMGEGSEGGQIRSGDDEVVNNGVGFLGYKKVVVTGLVMSAAAVLVPPLVMGFVFLGPPCAVLWGSYAFTRRVLSFLLPVPDQVQPLGGHDDDYNDVDHKVEIEFEADPDVSNITQDQKPAGLYEDRNGDSTGAVKEGDEVIATEGSKQDDVDKQAGDDHQGSERSATVTGEKPSSDEGQSDQDKSSVAQVTSVTATETDQSKPGATESSKNDTAQSSDKGSQITPAKEELTKKAKIDGKEKKRHSKHGSK